MPFKNTVENLAAFKAEAVTKSTEQTIPSKKTFTNTITFDDNILVRGNLVSEGGFEVGIEDLSTASNLENDLGNASVIQKNIALDSVTWESDDENVATVDSHGNILAVGPGTATISATKIEDNVIYQGSCDVTVSIPNSPLFNSVVPSETILYTLDGSLPGTGSAYATENTATQDGITWKVQGNVTTNPWRIGGKSLTEENRVVYSTGQISGTIAKVSVAHGNFFGSSSKVVIHSLTLIVAQDADFQNVLYTETSYSISANSTSNFICPQSTIEEEYWTNAYYKLIYVISINTATNSGIELNSVTFYEGYEYIPATGIELDISQLTLMEGTEAQLTATVSPVDASNKNVLWSSADPSVATVSASGVVTGLTIGDTSITATSQDGGFTDVCSITVTDQAFDELKLNASSIDIRVGKTYKLKAYYNVKNIATGDSAIALGRGNTIHNNMAFAYGDCLESTADGQTLFGKYNNLESTAKFVIGNGTDTDHRSNAFEVHLDGRATVGANPTQDKDVATKEYVDENKGTKLYRHHFDIVVGHLDLPLIPEGTAAFINVNALSTSGEEWETLSELDGGGFIVSAFGTIPNVYDYIFELKLYYNTLNTLLLNIHDLTDNTVKAVTITTVNNGQTPSTFELQDGVTPL